MCVPRNGETDLVSREKKKEKEKERKEKKGREMVLNQKRNDW